MKPLTATQKSRTRSTDVWLTPKPLLDALGPFDVDPCAAPLPRPWPTAAVHMVESDDGLSTPWPNGLVWLNPPYTRANDWLEILAKRGNGIALVFARTETEGFFKNVWEKADAVFFLKGRLRFCRPDGTPMRKGIGASVLVAYGGEAVFCLEHCKLIGRLVYLRRQD